MNSSEGKPTEGVAPPIPKPGEEIKFDITELPSAQPVGEDLRSTLTTMVSSPILFEETDLEPGEPKIKVDAGGIIKIDRKALDEGEKSVIEYLKEAIARGDEKEIRRFLWYLEDREDEETKAFRQQLEEAFRSKNPASLDLDSLNVVLPLRTLAEKQLIKNALREQLKKIPFSFKDHAGNLLNQDKEVDFVFIPQGDQFKLVVASKKGIGSVALPESITDESFQPELMKIAKDQKAGTITIPLNKAKDGSEPMAPIIEIRKERIDLPGELLRQEEELEKQAKAQQPVYAPPPPSVSTTPYSQPRSQRPTTWVTTSH